MQEPVLLIATSNAEGSITGCDLHTGAVIATYKGNGSPPKGLCAVGQDYVAAAQTQKHALHFWTWHREQVLQRSFVAESIVTLAASPDGCFLAGGGSSGTLYLWEVASGRLLRTWGAHYKAATCLLFVGGPSLLLSGGEDTLVYAWLLPDLLDPSLDPASPAYARPAPLHAWSDHTLPVTGLAAGAGEAAALVASASADRTVKLRRLADGALLRSVALPAAINDIVLDAGEQVLYAAGADGAVYEVPLVPDSLASTSGRGAAAAGDAASAGAAGSLQGGGAYRAFQGHGRPVTCLALTSLGYSSSGGGGGGGVRAVGGEVLVSGSQDGTVRVWDVGSGQPVQVFSAPGKAAVSGILVLPRPRHMVVGTGRGGGAGGSTLGAELSTSGGGGGGRAGPQRMQPLAPLSKYAGTVGSLKRWEGAPIIVDGSVPFTGLASSSFLGTGTSATGLGAGQRGQQLLGLPAGLAAAAADGGAGWLAGEAGTDGGHDAAAVERAWEVALGV